MLKLDCRNGSLSQVNHDDEQFSNVLHHLDSLLVFENTQFFTLRTIDLMLKKYPDLYLLSEDAVKFSELALAANRMMVVRNDHSIDHPITHLEIYKELKFVKSELKHVDTDFTDDGIRLVFEDTPSHEVKIDVKLYGHTDQEEVSLGFLNLKDLYNLPIKISNAVVKEDLRFSNTSRDGFDYKLSTTNCYTQDDHQITLKDLLDCVFFSLDLFDPEVNQEVIDLLNERIESIKPDEQDQ